MRIRRTEIALLTVRGRKTGLPRSFPVALAKREDEWLLVAVYGVSDWSRNLEAIREATITIARRTTLVHARRLGPEEAGSILRESMTSAPALVQRMTAAYFTAQAGSDIRAWQQESVSHPVFVLTPSQSPTAGRGIERRPGGQDE